MTAHLKICILAGMVACAIAAWGAPVGLDPYIGYVYPAGGQQGTTFQVVTAGQRLQNVKDIYVTGNGVHAKVVSYVGANGPLNMAQQEELKRRLKEIADKRWPGREGNRRAKQQPPAQTAPVQQAPFATNTTPPAPATPTQPSPATKPPVMLPDFPELRNLEQLTPKQLRAVAEKFLDKARRPKPPMAEEVTLEVTIDPAATPGDREFRLRTPLGLTNPMIFQVGTLPEQCEPESKDTAEPLPPSNTPVVLNGQIMPGEVDRFPLQLHRGQQLTLVAEARYLIPYLADAVPGWFQAVMALYDPSGKEVAFQDDCGFDPDPIITYQVPQDGVYRVEIRDSIYRGRQDFIYRIVIGEPAQLRALFPSGSRGGVVWGLPSMPQGHPDTAVWGDKLPRSAEVEPNETLPQAKSVLLPRVIDGCISRPGDIDVYQFTGRAGDEVV
ncbi:MAG TPA: hypothetical protein VGM23_09110, partial [Armatimonadota bacterium]